MGESTLTSFTKIKKLFDSRIKLALSYGLVAAMVPLKAFGWGQATPGGHLC